MAVLNTKNILFVHPLGYTASAAGRDISRVANIMPPLGLAGLSAFLDRKGIKNAIVDCYARPDSDRWIRDYLLAEKPAAIGLSCTTSSFPDGIRIVRLAKGLLPDIRAVFGGPHVSALKEKALEAFPEMDVAVVGEGEETLLELASADFKPLRSIQGIVFREKEKTVLYSPRFRGHPFMEKSAGWAHSRRTGKRWIACILSSCRKG